MKLFVMLCLLLAGIMSYGYCDDQQVQATTESQAIFVTVDAQKVVQDMDGNVVGNVNESGKVCDATGKEIGYIDNDGMLRDLSGTPMVMNEGHLVSSNREVALAGTVEVSQ